MEVIIALSKILGAPIKPPPIQPVKSPKKLFTKLKKLGIL